MTGTNALTREIVVIDLKVLHVNHTSPRAWQLTYMAGRQSVNQPLGPHCCFSRASATPWDLKGGEMGMLSVLPVN